jgi:DNA-binding CsgD family transcriptional regulator
VSHGRIVSASPAGLSDRDVERLRLLASGMSNKQIAAELILTPKTVGRHIEHIYAKVDVCHPSGGPMLFAVEHGFVGAYPKDGAFTRCGLPTACAC